MFGTTIEENIRYGRSDVTQAEIEEACKKAFAHDFIMELPDVSGCLISNDIVLALSRLESFY